MDKKKERKVLSSWR